jgi:predicted AAA+ superfamily ATPase
MLRRFLTMLAHNQGGLYDASKVATGLEISPQTASRYPDLLVDLLLVRRLQPYHVRTDIPAAKSRGLFLFSHLQVTSNGDALRQTR